MVFFRKKSREQIERRVRICVVFSMGVFLLAFPGKVRSADQTQFKVHEISVEGWTLGVLHGDFNGDRLGDVAIIYFPTLGAHDRRYLAFFLQNKTSVFSASPSGLLELPATATQFQAVDLDGDGVFEILFVDNNGVQVVRFDTGSQTPKSRRLIRKNTIYSAGVFRGAIVENLAHDLSGSPGLEIIIPTSDGAAIFEKSDDGKYQLLNEISLTEVGARSSVDLSIFSDRSARSYVLEIPRSVVSDAGLDGRADIYFLSSRRSSLYVQDESGAFPRSADNTTIFTPFTSNEVCRSYLKDCNGDNRLDLVNLRQRGGISAKETKVDFYLANSAGFFSAVPTKTLTISQAHCGIELTDIDGDRIPELALPTIELGTMSAIKMMMQKKGSAYLLIYPLVAGVPQENLMVRKKLDFRLDYDSPRPDQEVTINWSADFNADGRKDLVYSDGAGSLKIFYGQSKGYITDEPNLEIEVEDAFRLSNTELNGDGRDDLIVESVNAGKANTVTVLLSTGL
ncbi:MAG: VCBS repeat-containing protein [candidate division Zixibacteria bacterium]|nr:VCBS repeat-containing protein [candidate division Zixibacteria bacterium]